MYNQLKRNRLLKEFLTESFQVLFSISLDPENGLEYCGLYPDGFWDATLDASRTDYKKRTVWTTYRIKLYTQVTDQNLESVIREFTTAPIGLVDPEPDTSTDISRTRPVMWITDFQSECFSTNDVKRILSRSGEVLFPEDLEKGRRYYEHLLAKDI